MTKPPVHDGPVSGYAGRVTAREMLQCPRRRGAALAGLVGLGLVASLSLTGCFAPPSSTGGGTGGTGQSGQGDGTDGGTTTSTSSGTDGTEQYAGLPSGFPSDEIPIIDGEVVFGIDLGTGWTVIVSVDDLQADYQAAAEKLKAAGYSALAESSSADGSFGAFENGTFQVQVTASETPDYGLTVTYLAVRLG